MARYNKARLPKHGTKRRELVRLMFRRAGMRHDECPAGLRLGSAVEALRCDFGLDIRQFPGRRSGSVGRPGYVYRIVGWDRPNGRYRSFVRETE